MSISERTYNALFIHAFVDDLFNNFVFMRLFPSRCKTTDLTAVQKKCVASPGNYY